MTIQPLKQCSLSIQIFVLTAIAVIYFLLGHVGLLAVASGTIASPIWPAAGFALAVMLIWGPKIAFAIIAGETLVSMISILEQNPAVPLFLNFSIAFIIGCGAALQTLAASKIIKTFYPTINILRHPASLLLFFLTTIICCLISATIASVSLSLFEIQSWIFFKRTWITWWIGDVGGMIGITPLVLAWIYFPLPRLTKGNILELLIIVLLFLFAMVVNYKLDGNYFYLFISPWLWSAVRFQFPGATLGNLITVEFIAYETARGYGHFVRDTFEETFFELEIFIIVITATILLVSAEIERKCSPTTVWRGAAFSFSKSKFFKWLYKKCSATL